MSLNAINIAGRSFVALHKAGKPVRGRAAVFHAVTPHCRMSLCGNEPGAGPGGLSRQRGKSPVQNASSGCGGSGAAKGRHTEGDEGSCPGEAPQSAISTSARGPVAELVHADLPCGDVKMAANSSVSISSASVSCCISA
jgi:hypothetical protein